MNSELTVKLFVKLAEYYSVASYWADDQNMNFYNIKGNSIQKGEAWFSYKD